MLFQRPLEQKTLNNQSLENNVRKVFSAFAFSLIFTLLPFSVSAQTQAQTEVSAQQQLHTDLVLSALQLDFYNARCRGLSIARNFNQVNRLFVTKYSLTANNYIKDYIAKDVREEKRRQEILFKRNLSRMGGCAKAKDAGWIKEIHDHYKELYGQAETSSWFPETFDTAY